MKKSVVPMCKDGKHIYRRVMLILMEVGGSAEDLETFDQLTSRVPSDMWIPIEFGSEQIQIACTDGQWHTLNYDLWGETIEPKPMGRVEPDSVLIPAASNYIHTQG